MTASPSIAQRVASGAALMVLLRTAVRLIGAASILVLARVLSPDDFGLVALAFVSVSILENLSEPLLQPFLVRAREADRALYDVGWTLGLLRAGAVALLVVLSAPLLATAMHEPRLVALMQVFALAALLQGFENVGMVAHLRALDYDAILKWRLASKIAGTLVTIPLAVATGSYWALAAGIIAGRIASVVGSYWLSPYRPRLRLRGAHEMARFATWMFGYGALDTIESYLMTVMLGRLSGPVAVGTFTVAYTLGAMPCSEIAAPVREPLYVGLATARNDGDELPRRYLSGLALLAMVLLPMSVGIALTAHLIVPPALGPAWSGATTLVRICALYAFFDALTAYTVNLFVVLDRLRTLVGTFAVLLALRVPAAVIGFVLSGVDGAAAGLLAASLCGAVAWHVYAARVLGIAMRDILASIWRSVCAVGAMAAVLLALAGPLADAGTSQPLAALLAAVAAGALAYGVVQLMLWSIAGRPHGAEQICLSYVHELWGRVIQARERQRSA